MNTTLSQLIRNLIDGANCPGFRDDLLVVNSADVAALEDYLVTPQPEPIRRLITNLIDVARDRFVPGNLAVVNSADVIALQDYLEKPVQPIVVTMTVAGAISVSNVPDGQTVEVHDYGCPDDWEGYEEDEDGDVFQRIICKE